MVLIGTSGYNYPEWRGSFYPADLKAAQMLPFYAARFPTVEINYTFYRMPTEKILAGWASATPDAFRLTLKAPRRITHDARLQRCESLVRTFCDVAQTLGPKLGALLFQLPPAFKKDLGVLERFLELLPPAACTAFEFRHPSWLGQDVQEVLRARKVALCIADSDRMSTPVVATAPFGYFRLRDEGYTRPDIARWARSVEANRGTWREVFVYFKHEEQGKGPEFARLLMQELGLPPPAA
jgi:uncharacterized protein YecE (DUF72 family)